MTSAIRLRLRLIVKAKGKVCEMRNKTKYSAERQYITFPPTKLGAIANKLIQTYRETKDIHRKTKEKQGNDKTKHKERQR